MGADTWTATSEETLSERGAVDTAAQRRKSQLQLEASADSGSPKRWWLDGKEINWANVGRGSGLSQHLTA